MDDIHHIIDSVIQGCSQGGIEVSEVLAAFVARTVVETNASTFSLDRNATEEQTQEVILQSIEKLLEKDNPSLEMIKMQVDYDSTYLQEENEVQKKLKARNKLINKHKLAIVEIEMADGSDYEALTTLYRKIFKFLLEFTPNTKLADRTVEREIAAALESVFPRVGLKAFISLNYEDKVTQLLELARIILGIRLFNRDEGRGGAGIDDMDKDANILAHVLSQDIDREVDYFVDACAKYQKAIVKAYVVKRKQSHEESEAEAQKLQQKKDNDNGTNTNNINNNHNTNASKINPLQVNEVTDDMIERWSQELANRRQYLGFLRTLQDETKFLLEKISTICNNLRLELNNVKSLVTHKSAIPKEIVYPRFDAIGSLWLQLFEEVLTMIARSNTFQALCKYRLSFNPTLTEKFFLDVKSNNNHMSLAASLEAVDNGTDISAMGDNSAIEEPSQTSVTAHSSIEAAQNSPAKTTDQNVVASVNNEGTGVNKNVPAVQASTGGKPTTSQDTATSAMAVGDQSSPVQANQSTASGGSVHTPLSAPTNGVAAGLGTDAVIENSAPLQSDSQQQVNFPTTDDPKPNSIAPTQSSSVPAQTTANASTSGSEVPSIVNTPSAAAPSVATGIAPQSNVPASPEQRQSLEQSSQELQPPTTSSPAVASPSVTSPAVTPTTEPQQATKSVPKGTVINVDDPTNPYGLEEVSASGARLLSVHNTPDFMLLPLELQGYCPWTIVQARGLLIPGKPSLGIVRYDNMYYVFDHPLSIKAFMENPTKYLSAIRERALRNPEFINLLRLHKWFPTASIAKLLKMHEMETNNKTGQPLTKDASTETPTHFMDSYIDIHYHWNEWELRRRALKMVNLMNCKTSSQQTDESHFKRDCETQVYLHRVKGTQTKRDKGTNPPTVTTYVAGLRGKQNMSVQKKAAVEAVIQGTTYYTPSGGQSNNQIVDNDVDTSFSLQYPPSGVVTLTLDDTISAVHNIKVDR